MTGPRKALVSLGSNLGDRRANLRRGLALLERQSVVVLLAVSSFHRSTAAEKCVGGGEFINAVTLLATPLGIGDLGRLTSAVENRLGRREDRRRRDHARRLDLDLLLMDGEVGEEDGFIVPHPRLLRRAFILRPAAGIAPGMIVPTTGLTLAEHLGRLRDSRRGGLSD